MSTSWTIPEASFSVSQAGVLAAPSGVTDGFTVAGRTTVGVFTNPAGGVTQHSYRLWFFSAEGSKWSVYQVASGALGATSHVIVFSIPPNADRVYVQTTVANGGNVGYEVTLSGSSYAHY